MEDYEATLELPRHRLTPVEEAEELYTARLLPTNYRAAFREAMRACAMRIERGEADPAATLAAARLEAVNACADAMRGGAR